MKFEELYETYGKCLYPKVVIKINQVEEKAIIEELQVSLSMMKKANSCTIRYRFDSEKVLLQMSKKLKIGSVLHLSLGYDNDVEPVFLGYLHAIEITQYTQDFTLELYAQDVMGLMMNHQRFLHYKEKSAQQILEDILQDTMYASFIKKRTIQKQKDILASYTSWAKNDFETIKSICEEKSRIFYVRNDEFIVEEMGTSFTPEIVFTSFGIDYIKLVHCAQNIKGNVVLQGFDKDNKAIQCKEVVNLSKYAYDVSRYKASTLVKRFETTVDQSVLKKTAQDMGKRIVLEASSIQFSCLYIPQLQCGRKLNFEAISCIQLSCILSELEITLQDHHFSCEGKAILI